MLLGLAVGDALGMTTEGPGWNVERRKKLYPGDVRDYFNGFQQPDPLHGIGRPSDDTQLAFWTLEQMVTDGGFNPENVARLFRRARGRDRRPRRHCRGVRPARQGRRDPLVRLGAEVGEGYSGADSATAR